MKKLALLLLLLSYFTASAQHPLSYGRRTSVYEYLYELSNDEALEIYSHGAGKINNTFLHTLKDSFPHDKGIPQHLPPGNYLRVYAENDKLQTVFTPVPNVFAKLAYNNHDLIVILHDKKGGLVKDAALKIGRHTLRYEAQAYSWWYDKYERSGLLQIYHKGLLNCITLNGSTNYYRSDYYRNKPLRILKRKLSVARLRRRQRNYKPYHYSWPEATAYEHRYNGYMVFSKPIYKPGDTLKFKAFITDKRGKPVNKPLLVRLSDDTFVTDTILTTLQPYTPGGYSWEIALTPGLELLLDDRHRISLEAEDSPAFSLSDHDGTLEDQREYHAKRKILITGEFKLEEYELHTVTFTARTDQVLHTSREKVAVYLQAKDENDLPVMDGQAQIFITKPEVKKSYINDLLLPDTLWQYKGPVDVLGETKITIPDSIFPKADLNYQIECILTNSNNERKTVKLQQVYRYDKGRISFDMQRDSLYITLAGGYDTDDNACIYELNQTNDTIGTYKTRLPAAIKINPFALTYEVQSEHAIGSYMPKPAPLILSCNVSWHNDTAAVHVDNPHKQAFWYTFFENRKVIMRGYGDTLSWQASTLHNKQYELRISYIWKGKMSHMTAYLKDPEQKLNITMDGPKTVYPGQTAEITVNVKDKYQRPVAETDVTAYAYTSKFDEEEIPSVPSFNKPYKAGKYHAELTVRPNDISSLALPLEWERYSKRMGLDSLLFFRFTHPSPIFTFTEPTEDHTAQIAPFVFARGSVQPVHIMYVDEQPVYYSMTNPIQPYSIRVRAGKHKISLRTPFQRITLDQVIADSVKTFISIDSAIQQQDVMVSTSSQELSSIEAGTVEDHLLHLKNTFGNSPVYIRQRNQLFNLNADGRLRRGYSQYTVGPLTGARTSLVVKDIFKQDVTPEPGYLFEINRGLIKQKEITVPKQYDLRKYRSDTSLSAQPLTEDAINRMIKEFEDEDLRTQHVIPPSMIGIADNSRLLIHMECPDINPAKDVLAFLLFRYDDPSFAKSFKGVTTEFLYLKAGHYKLLTLLTGDRYFVKDSILLKKHHLHYYTFDTLNILPADTISRQLEKELRRMVTSEHAPRYHNREMQLTAIYNPGQIYQPQLTRIVSGIVVDSYGEPFVGAEVAVRDGNSECLTDEDGKFTLRVTQKGALDVNYPGYKPSEQKLNDGDVFYRIILTPEIHKQKNLEVTALGIKREQKALGYAVSTITSEKISMGEGYFTAALYGKAAGVEITTPPVSIGGLFIGENDFAAADEESNPLPTSPANSLRTNFRDDAFWQPRLRTDANGNARFKVTFPDDITGWKTYAIAMNGKFQSGMNRTFIRSYKTLSGNLALPQFTVEGDSILLISKALNYTPETITVTRTFSVNDSIYKTGNISFKNAFIDTIPVVIGNSDSVSFRYTVTKEGYMDGEQRKIPIIQSGTEETSGMFAALYNDTSFTYVQQHPGPLQVHAESAVLPVLLDEIMQVQQYKYLCNEQLASKLKAYLLEKKIAAYTKKDFKKDKDIAAILKRLDNQKKNGLWGWWENSPVSVWISRHVIEALLLAKEQGYDIAFKKQAAIDQFVYELNGGEEHDSIGCMELLASLGAKIDYAAGIDSIISRSGKSGYDTIRLALLRQKTGLPFDISPILSREKNTVFGNAYWGMESYDLFNNSIQRTLQVYKLLRKAGGHEVLLQKIRGYFLEQRKDGHWRNTYESALILETILPDVLEDEAQGPVAIDINGRHINRFPYTDTLIQAGKINISKQGKRPVYFTAYQQFFNREPQKVSGLFDVSSVFSANGTTQQDLKAGVPVTLKVAVTVQKTADYVLIEIPIPAGCSYQGKSQGWANNEVHREHFKDRVSIFCSQLSPGIHTFDVSLLPRYSGNYHLNPAKAEMQYFPVFMGREALKKVNIRTDQH